MSGKRSALIVATGQYKDARLAPLDGPAHDAEALRSALADKDIGGFDVRIALNSRVETLRRTLESFFTDRARDDLLLVHFSGHGLKDDDGQLYLAAADTQIDRLLSTAIDASWVNRMMNRCRSERIVLFLDCCFAGAFTSGMVRRAGVDTAGIKEHFGGSGLFVIAASDAMQYSFESGRQVGQMPEPSPFTRALVDGLVSGEADRDEDGFVSIDELFDYLEDRIRETSPSQTPTKSAFNQVGDWVIARSTRQPSIRMLPTDLQVQIKSDDTLDRFAALIALRDLAVGPDARVGDAARDALRRLSEDDSRRVASTAQQLLAQLPQRARSSRSRRPTPPAEPAQAAAASAPAAAAESAAEPAVSAAPEPSEPAELTQPAAPVVMAPITTPADALAPMPPMSIAATQPEAAAMSPIAPPVAPPQTFESTPTYSAPAPPYSDAAQTYGASAPFAPKAPAWNGRQKRAFAPADRAARTGEWSTGRAIVRIALGTFLFTIFQYTWYLSANQWVVNDPSTLDPLTTAVSQMAAVVTAVTTAILVPAEQFVLALRLPQGTFYRVVANNRWASALVLGALVAWIAGSIVAATWDISTSAPHFAVGPETLLCGALGFLAAEFLAARWFGAQSTGAAAS